MLLNVLSNSPNIGDANALCIWIIACIYLVAFAFVEYFLALFLLRYRNKAVEAAALQRRVEIGGEMIDGNKEQPMDKTVEGPKRKPFIQSMDTYSLALAPILFLTTFMIYFAVMMSI